MNFLTPAFFGGALAAAFVFLFSWALQVKMKNAGLVDLAWVLGLVLMSSAAFIGSGGWLLRRALIFFMVMSWGSRLFFHLLTRFLKEPAEDKRYAKMRKKFGDKAGANFFLLFLFQAILVIFLSAPFFIIGVNPKPTLGFFELAGVFLWAAGFAGESVADSQLQRFKSDPKNKGRVCDNGLWNYSRHPNYFFECVIWVSYSVFALGSPGGVWAVLPALTMIFFITRVSGIPPAEEQALASRGEAYHLYQKTTSAMIPWFKKAAS